MPHLVLQGKSRMHNFSNTFFNERNLRPYLKNGKKNFSQLDHLSSVPHYHTSNFPIILCTFQVGVEPEPSAWEERGSDAGLGP